MGIIEILLTSLGLSADAFAVSICKGLSMKKYDINKGLIIGLYFGMFQGLMPLIGYLLGSAFQDIIISIDNTSVNKMTELQEYIFSKSPEDEIILTVIRNNKEKQIRVVLGEK